MIRTASPFGHFFIALFLLAGFVFGVFGFAWGCRKHSIRAKWLGGGLVALICTLLGGGVVVLICTRVAREIVIEGNLEWNPWIKNDAEIAGTWADRKQALTLAINGTFSYRSSARTVSGTWTREDFNLYLHGVSFSTMMRFVQYRGQYRIMTHPPEDPDTWDGDIGLSRK